MPGLERILRLPEVMAATGWSRSAIYAEMRAGRLPTGRKLGAKSVGWLESEILAWQRSRQLAGPSTWPAPRPVKPSNGVSGWPSDQVKP